jgi:two-component system, sensor histidine kinase YesM
MKKNILRKLLSYYKDLPIKNKLLLLFYIQIIIPLLLIGYMSYEKSSEIIKNKSVKYSSDIIKMMELRYRDLSENLNALSLELLYDSRIHDALKEDNNGGNSLDSYKNANDIRDKLREATLSRNEVQSMSIVNNKNKIYSFDSNSASARMESITNYEQMLQKARSGKGKVVWIEGKKGNKVENIYVTRVIYDRENYKEMGLIAILIKKEFVQSVNQEISDETSENITILSENNDIILGQDKVSNKIIKELAKHKDKEKGGYFIDKDEGMLISCVTLDNPNWKIVYHIYLSDLYKEINILRFWIYFVVICSLLILSIISIFSSLDIVNPINALVKGMRDFEKSKKHEEIIVNRNDELGYMANSFNYMSKRMDFLVNRIYTEEITRKEAEITALQAQINPHFLFNTLESINWMAQLNGVTEISEIVTSLGKILDANIGRGSKLVTIAEEFDYIDNYINILRNRYGDRLNVIKCIDENVLNIKIPRFLIQPIVENSVYHGIEKIIGLGIIDLRAYLKESMVFIEIVDNGPGLSRAALDKLNSSFNEVTSIFAVSDDVKNRKSIGLENVNRRIKLFYGETYGLYMESKVGEYTKVIVKLPMKIVNEGELKDV